jgi:hypothetical protein
MSCLVLKNATEAPVPIGTMIVAEGEFARPYDEKTDDIEDVIGVIYPTFNASGRAIRIQDGPEYYLNDAFLWDQNLQYQVDPFSEYEDYVTNPDYTPWNPNYELDKYCTIVYNGFCPVAKPHGALPARWKVLKTWDYYDWVLIR